MNSTNVDVASPVASGELERPPGGVIDWMALLFDPQRRLAEALQATAGKRFAGTVDGESAFNFALDTCAADDWRLLREGYSGTGSAEGFLRVTFVRLMNDYAVRKYGRKRPPTWVQRAGTMWVRAFELLCLQRAPREVVVERLVARFELAEQEARTVARQVKGRIPNCGEFVGEYVDDGDGDNAEGNAGTTEAPDDTLSRRDAQHLIAALAAVLRHDDRPPPVDAAGATHDESLVNRARTLHQALNLTADDRLLLKLLYQDGVSIPKVAELLGKHQQKVRRLHKSLLARVHAVLSGMGLDASALAMLEE